MPSMGQGPYLAAPTTVLSTGLNALAAGARAISAALDNGTDRALWAMLELLVTFGTGPTAGSAMELYLLPSIDDGASFADGDAATVPAPGSLAAVFAVRSVITAQRVIVPRLLIPPGQYKWLIQNSGNQPMAATGNTLRERRWELEST